MRKLKFGVFGLRRGMIFANILLKRQDVELTAVCDFYEPALTNIEKKAKEKGISVKTFKSFDDFFECDLDAVILANYATEHVPYAIRLLNSGRHVLSECVLSQTLKEAVELVEAAEKSKAIYQFAENVCFLKTITEMKRRYNRGDIGEIAYCEGEYIHPNSYDIYYTSVFNYGDKDHWRFHIPSTLYSSHAIGPLLYITGTRPVSVTAFEIPPFEKALEFGKRNGQASMMMLELSNGATMKVLNGALRKKPYPLSFQLHGQSGSMETDRWKENIIHIYTDHEFEGKSGYDSYECTFPEKHSVPEGVKGHSGSDYITLDLFIQSILGNEDAKAKAVDIYSALDMCLPGIFGYRSVLNDNSKIIIPNFRCKDERARFKDDIACTDVKVAGSHLLPTCSKGDFSHPDELYDYFHELWMETGEETPYFSND